MTDRMPHALRDEHGASLERASATPNRRSAVKPKKRDMTMREMPRSLVELETWMLAAITDRADGGLETIVTPGPRLTAAERLDVYQSGYCARLVECLLDDYPAMAAALGVERFETLCHSYFREHPSRSPNLNAFGRHMASFCASASMLSTEERVFYSDLAKLEWSIVEVIHAEAAKPLDVAILQTLTPEQWATARFERSDAVQLLGFAHPVNAFFQEWRTADGVVPKIPDPAPSATAVYRERTTVWRMDLTPAMTRVLGALLDRETITDALGQIGDDDEEAERSVMIWFREWVSGGMFSKLVFEGT